VTKLRVENLVKLLRENPRSGSSELCARLGGIDRATLARAIKTLGEAVIVGGESRRTRYALRRSLRGSNVSIPLYRIDEHGSGHEVALLSLIQPEGSFLAPVGALPWPLDESMSDGWFEGLPYILSDMRPQGFLGRNFALAKALDLGVSENPEAWSDEDVVHVLAAAGYDQPGDLILGEVAYRRFLNYRSDGRNRFVTESTLESEYVEYAEHAMRHGAAGSSAGGEFPKFTASRLTNSGDGFHAIVKFSGADDSAAVRRWSDLLICEHHASLVVAQDLGVPTANSTVYRFKGRTFLEVVRFDRHGNFGRSSVCTLESLDAALIGNTGDWPNTTSALHNAGWLSEESAEHALLVWWFGKLIGNSDMHGGNLAFFPGLKLAPLYDMLPMMYAPLRGGELPNRIFSPPQPLPTEVAIWVRAAKAAIHFWSVCSGDARIGGAFRQTCEDNSKKVRTLLSVD
jgi:hypothetical protein